MKKEFVDRKIGGLRGRPTRRKCKERLAIEDTKVEDKRKSAKKGSELKFGVPKVMDYILCSRKVWAPHFRHFSSF